MTGDVITSADGAPVPHVEERIRLRDLEFSDLYVSAKGEVMIRGINDADGALSDVPGAVSDLDDLQMVVFERGQTKREFFVDYDGIRYRCSKIEALQGDWFTLRKSKAEVPRLRTLGGFPPPVMSHLAWLGQQHGLLVFSGPTGSGKTTTASSLLREYLLAFGDIAVTIEDPPELPLDGPHGNFGRCFQLRLEDEDFGMAMVRTLRYTPRYILLGELRKSHDASQALRAAISGHLVLTTIHAGTIEETITSLLKLAGAHESQEFAQNLMADGLAGIINQRLVKANGRTRLVARTLFPGDDKAVRSLIREGQVSQLGTYIEQQAARVAQGKPPVEVRTR